MNEDGSPSPKKDNEGTNSPGISPRATDGPSPLQRARTKMMGSAQQPTEEQYKEIFEKLFSEKIKSEPFETRVAELVKDHLPK